MLLLHEPITEMYQNEDDHFRGSGILECGGMRYFFKAQYTRGYTKGNFLLSETRAFNEVFTSVIGRFMGLPIPEVKFINQHYDNQYCYGSAMEIIDNAEEWFYYVASKHGKGLLDGLVNKEDIVAGYLFDRIIANTDRDRNNVVVQRDGEKHRLFFIDHDYAILGSDDRKNNVDFINLDITKREIDRKYPKEFRDFYYDNVTGGFISNFVGRFLDNCFKAFLNETKEAFMEVGDIFISEEEYNVAEKLVLKRAEIIRDYHDKGYL